jgi:hypothetical protein
MVDSPPQLVSGGDSIPCRWLACLKRVLMRTDPIGHLPSMRAQGMHTCLAA